MNKDNILRLYSRLVSLRKNLPEGGWGVKDRYIQDYHEVVDGFSQEIQGTLDEFKVPVSEIKPQMTSWSPSEGAKYSNDQYCEHSFMRGKVDALINYVEIAHLHKGE